MVRKISIIIIFALTCTENKSQDFIFSQYFASQPYLNPAMTGFFDGSYRVNVQMRNQWQGISSGINTYGVNADFKFGKNNPEEDYFAMGVCVYRDEIFKKVNYHTGRINASFTKRLGYGSTAQYLSIGGNFGMDNKSVKNSYTDPLTGFMYIAPGSAERIQKTSLLIPNMGLGLNYQIIFPSFANIFFGVGADHLVSDKASLFNTNESVEKRITVYTSARLRVTENRFFLLPTFMMVNQGTSKQTNFGISAQILTRNYYVNKSNFQIGLFTRLGNQSIDAIIPVFRYENRGIQLGLSYDHNVSELSSATGGYGGLEISLGYIGFIERIVGSRTECPNLKNF